MVPAEHKSTSSLRADFPFPVRGGEPAYFETAISRTEHIMDPSFYFRVTVGFCGEFCDLTQSTLRGSMWSVGYDGLDGGIYKGFGGRRDLTGRKFGHSNTVGCGIDYNRKEYFFTLGKEVVGMSMPKRIQPRVGERMAK